LTFEEFIAGLAERGELDLRFDGPAAPVLLHGHCHQKALVGTGPTVAVLRAAGYQVSEVDAGCCGMAGSFGHRHPELSQRIAADRLVPAMRDAGVAVAAGTSCREQIRRTTGRAALHPAELIAARLA
jgi:Fe-S oxidoreductase